MKKCPELLGLTAKTPPSKKYTTFSSAIYTYLVEHFAYPNIDFRPQEAYQKRCTTIFPLYPNSVINMLAWIKQRKIIYFLGA